MMRYGFFRGGGALGREERLNVCLNGHSTSLPNRISTAKLDDDVGGISGAESLFFVFRDYAYAEVV